MLNLDIHIIRISLVLFLDIKTMASVVHAGIIYRLKAIYQQSEVVHWLSEFPEAVTEELFSRDTERL